MDYKSHKEVRITWCIIMSNTTVFVRTLPKIRIELILWCRNVKLLCDRACVNDLLGLGTVYIIIPSCRLAFYASLILPVCDMYNAKKYIAITLKLMCLWVYVHAQSCIHVLYLVHVHVLIYLPLPPVSGIEQEGSTVAMGCNGSVRGWEGSGTGG